MSLLLEAFPPGRPSPCARTALPPARIAVLGPRCVTVLVTVLALVVVVLPMAGVAAAGGRSRRHLAHQHTAHKNLAHRHPAKRTHSPTVPPVIGQPPRNYVIPAASYFSFPNRGDKERMAIRNRVLYTIQSVWGGRRDALGTPLPGNGTIRIATWSFDDWGVAKALVAARKRGVSVQVLAARSANLDHPAWSWLRTRLGSRLDRPGHPSTSATVSFARQCRGACRGPGGTPHSKFFLFQNVGATHARDVVVQTSMNLTRMAYWGQWNEALAVHSSAVYRDFSSVFWQARLARPVAQPYHVAALGPYVDYFFPRPRATAAQDPVMQNLGAVRCTGATTGAAGGRTSLRIIQYAIYGDRGVWIAKRLRALWNAGCDIAIIYSVASRPVLALLRNHAGRGAIPMRQSVTTDPWGNVVKYNHSKWMTIAGHWGKSTAAYLTFDGSANWADLAFGDDEQMQLVSSRTEVLRHVAAFAKTWRQRSSSRPTAGRVVAFGRVAMPAEDLAPEPTFGQGVYRYLSED